MNNPALGNHCILELGSCPAELLGNEKFVRKAIKQAAAQYLSSLHKITSKKSNKKCVSATGLLEDSHISIRTWPELGYAACDIYTCGRQMRHATACDFLVREFKAGNHSLKVVPRGRSI